MALQARKYFRSGLVETASWFRFITVKLGQSDKGMTTQQLNKAFKMELKVELTDERLLKWLKELSNDEQIYVAYKGELHHGDDLQGVPRPYTWVLSDDHIDAHQEELVTAMRLVKKFIPFLVRSSPCVST